MSRTTKTGPRPRPGPSAPSKTQVDKAGRLLSRFLKRFREVGELSFSEFDAEKVNTAVALVEAWRSYHAPVLSSVAANLRYYTAEEGSAQIAQRLKRYPTIVDKLLREPSMRLSQMADIGGARAVLPDQAAVDGVVRRLRKNWTVVDLKDYVREPKDDGYRAMHLIVRRRGRLIEVQLRTPFQHLWANMVEEDSRRLGSDLKSGGGTDDLRASYKHLADQGAQVEAGLADRPVLVAAMQAVLVLADRLSKADRSSSR